MCQKGHLRAQSCFSWSMTCILVGEKKNFSPQRWSKTRLIVQQPEWNRCARYFFTLRRRHLYHLRSRWWASQLTLVAFKKRVGRRRRHTNAHKRTFMSLGSRWPSTSASASEDRAAAFLSRPRRPAAKLPSGKPTRGMEFIFTHFRRWSNDLVSTLRVWLHCRASLGCYRKEHFVL